MMNVDMHFYGERGIVNGILLDIGKDQKKLNGFFQAIKLFGTDDLPWKDGIDSCQWVIEPNFAEFGNPDLIAIIQSSGRKYALFIEAKLLSYADSCFPLPAPFDATQLAGKSSLLNVQLALRYRFTQAFQSRNTADAGVLPIIEEDGSYADGQLLPRKLKKPSVLKLIDETLSNVQEYYFIALTNDQLEDDSPLTPFEVHYPPLYLKETQRNRYVDDDLASCFGLLTYQSLMAREVVDARTGFFGRAWHVMGMDPKKSNLSIAPTDMNEKVMKTEKQQLSAPQIGSIDIKAWGTECKRRASWFAQDERLKLQDVAGSYSAKAPEGRVVMKLMLDTREGQSDQLILGLYNNKRIRMNLVKDLQTFVGTVGGGAHRKEFVFFPFDIHNDDLCARIKEMALLYMDSWEDDEAEQQ